MIVEVVEELGAFEALQSEWNEAAAAAADPNVFLTWDWLRVWWRHFGEGSPRARLHVVLVRDGDGLVAAAPFFRVERGRGPIRATLLQQISFDAGDYGGILLVRRYDDAVGELLNHFIEQLRQGVGTLVLSRLASDSIFLAHLRSGLADRGRHVTATELVLGDSVCPYTDVRNGFDMERRLKKNRVPQRLRRLREAHDVAFEYHTGPTLEEGIERLVDLHGRRWADRSDEFQGLLASPAGQAYLGDAIRAMDARGWQRLLSLTADGRPIAVRLDFEYSGRLYMLKHAIDPEFTQFGPGHLTHHRIFEDGLANGIVEFDFLRGDNRYKRSWSNCERHLVAVTLTRTGLAGRIATNRARIARRLA